MEKKSVQFYVFSELVGSSARHLVATFTDRKQAIDYVKLKISTDKFFVNYIVKAF